MSHSCFVASAFAKATCVCLTLHRLEFPANVRVHIQVSVIVELPAFHRFFCKARALVSGSDYSIALFLQVNRKKSNSSKVSNGFTSLLNFKSSSRKIIIFMNQSIAIPPSK